MKKVILLLSLLLLLAACGGAETAVSVPDIPAEEEETAVVEPVTEEVSTEEILPIAAKPQLVEFYADW